jgi:hypothetical protein
VILFVMVAIVLLLAWPFLVGVYCVLPKSKRGFFYVVSGSSPRSSIAFF